MKTTPFRRGLGVLAVAAMVMVPMAVATAAFAEPSPESTATVGNGTELVEQWAITNNTLITLTDDIELDCLDGYPSRDPGGSGIVVDGQGLYGITQTCDFNRVLFDEGDEQVTLRGLTHFEGGFACGAGGGLYTNGPAVVENSVISDNEAREGVLCVAAVEDEPVGGGVYSGGPTTVTNSTFDHNHADLAGGGFAAVGTSTVTGSSFVENSVGRSGDADEDTYSGAGFATLASAAVSSSTFTGNFFGDDEGRCENCAVVGGGFWAAEAADVSGSTFTGNLAECEVNCVGVGGAIATYDALTVGSSTFARNRVGCDGGCDALGGAIYAPTTDVSASSFDRNHAGCSGECDNEGGAILTGAFTVAGSSFTDNDASCTDECAAYGGAIVAGGLQDDASARSYAPDVQAEAMSGWGGTPGPSITALDDGDMTISQSTFSGNTAVCDEGNCGGSGGAVLLFEPNSLSIDASTFDHNVATYEGGAILVLADHDPPVSLTNSTVTQNTSGLGGAIVFNAGPAAIAYDTIVQNIVVEPPTVDALADEPANLTASEPTFFGTIIALPVGSGVNCDVAAETSEGYNFSDDLTCGLDDSTDDVAAGNDPGLNALGDNGGPTQTMLPQTGSPVIDAIPTGACQTGVADGITDDQRGITRPQGPGCDIGAVEVEFVPPEPPPTPVPAAIVITPRFTG